MIMKRTFNLSLLLLLALVLSMTSIWAERDRPLESRPVTPRGALNETERAMVNLFDAAAPSVAYITTETEYRRGFFSEQIGIAQGAGSGFIWDNKGHVVTNHHVIAGASRVLVQIDAGKEPVAATLVGSAPEYDLAVVKLEKIPSGIRQIPLGTSQDLKVGQSVIAIGNPFGLNRTLTTGIVSALDRYLPTQDMAEIGGIGGVIQTDAAINPGNSGGPLLDSAGRLIGVNTAIRSASGSSAGVGFAIPVDTVNRIVPQLIARGIASRPGIGIEHVDPGLVARWGIKGVVIAGVRRGTPAADAGLLALTRRGNGADLGDIITGVNGRNIDTFSTYFAELDRVGIGNIAELTITNDGKTRKIRVKVIDTNRRTGSRV
jgi:2-alkenal reductase